MEENEKKDLTENEKDGAEKKSDVKNIDENNAEDMKKNDAQPTEKELDALETKRDYPGLKPEQIKWIKSILFVVLMCVAILLFALKGNV